MTPTEKIRRLEAALDKVLDELQASRERLFASRPKELILQLIQARKERDEARDFARKLLRARWNYRFRTSEQEKNWPWLKDYTNEDQS